MKLIGSLTAVMMMVSAASAVAQSAKTAHEFEFTSIEGAPLPSSQPTQGSSSNARESGVLALAGKDETEP